MGTAELASAAFWESDESYALGPSAPLAQAPRGSLLVQTSGTEGRPKWVVLGKAGFLASAAAVNAHLEATAADRWLIALPTHHVGGFAIYARSFVAGCGLAQYQGKWDAPRFAQVCAQERITLTSLVPTQVYDLVQQRLAAPDSLRAIVVGGGALSKDIGQRAIELGWPVLQSFGMTEAGSQVATEPLDHLYAGFDPESLEVLPHWQVQVDASDFLTLRGDSLATGYLIAAADDTGTWEWQPLGGVLRTRDRVQLWDHGTRRFLRFLGRESHTVKILGELVHLQPLQARLDALALAQGVTSRCVIVPLEDARMGTELTLVSDGDGARLLEPFNAIVEPYQRLRGFRQVEALPLTDLGKVRLPELQRRLDSNP